jgi:hypothetical protein
LNEPVGECGFAVIDMGDDAEIANFIHKQSTEGHRPCR